MHGATMRMIWRVFNARYELSSYITQIRFFFKVFMIFHQTIKRDGCLVSKTDTYLKCTGF